MRDRDLERSQLECPREERGGDGQTEFPMSSKNGIYCWTDVHEVDLIRLDSEARISVESVGQRRRRDRPDAP